MTNILITGGTGLLGPYLRKASDLVGRTTVSGRRGGDFSCDLTDSAAVRALVAAARPDLVFHCAAMIDVDGCELEPGRAQTVNRDTVRFLADELPEDVVLTYFSTDQVYPDNAGSHNESDTGPVNAYGRTKYEGELAALNRKNSLVLRVNFFGPSLTAGRRSLSDWLVENLRARNAITLFTDSLFSPLHLETLATLSVDAATSGLCGVYNLGCRDGASKSDFAFALADHLGLPTDMARPGLSTTVSSRAHRAKDLRMNVERFEKAMRRPMPTLLEEVARL